MTTEIKQDKLFALIADCKKFGIIGTLETDEIGPRITFSWNHYLLEKDDVQTYWNAESINNLTNEIVMDEFLEDIVNNAKEDAHRHY